MIYSLRPVPIQRLQRFLSPYSLPMATAPSAKIIDGNVIAKSLYMYFIFEDNIDRTTPGQFAIALPRGSMR